MRDAVRAETSEFGYNLVDVAKSAAIVQASEKILSTVRAVNAPLIHVATYSRHESPWAFPTPNNPFWKYQTGRSSPAWGVRGRWAKNVEGSNFAEILPALALDFYWELFLRHVADDAPFPFTLLEGTKGVQLAEVSYRSNLAALDQGTDAGCYEQYGGAKMRPWS
jgi:hypothetical protein